MCDLLGCSETGVYKCSETGVYKRVSKRVLKRISILAQRAAIVNAFANVFIDILFDLLLADDDLTRAARVVA